jgi:chitinase
VEPRFSSPALLPRASSDRQEPEVTDLRTAKVLVLAALATLLLMTTTFSTAIFTDSTSSTAQVRAAADWTPPAAELSGATRYVRGAVTLTASASDADSALAEVRVEQRTAGAGAWTTLCTQPRSPLSCAWDTTRLPDGGYDVRVTATDTAGNVGRATATVTVDNTAPSLRLVDPGSPLSGTVRLAASDVADITSAVATVEFRYAVAGSSTWTTLCTADRQPWACDADTRPLPYGSYDLQARATDLAGNSATSARVAGRVVDNVVSSVTLTPLPTLLTGPVTLQASPASTAGVLYVRLQYAPAGTSTWTQVCEVTREPFSCSWDTTKVADGTYDVRAQLIDGTGRYSTSTVQAGRRVQNAAPPAVTLADVQAVNGTGVKGQIDAGDRITLTFSCQVDLRTVQAGWTGASVSVPFLLRDVAEVETLEIGGLGVVNLNGNYSKKDRTLSIPATMTAGSVTVDGQPRTTVTITLGVPPSGSTGTLETATAPTTLTWAPPATVKNLAGQTCLSGTVTESGPADVDF